MKEINIYIKLIFGLVILSILSSCEPFMDVEVPNDRITGETVFNNNQTALNALDGLYSQLFNTSFAAGGSRSVSFVSALSGDNFNMTSSNEEMREFFDYEIHPENTYNLQLWSGAYQTIYMANDLLEGAENSPDLNESTRNRIIGEAKFVRAFAYFYLVNLYHDVPLILTTDYSRNTTAQNTDSDDIKSQILSDLTEALSLIGDEYPNAERTYANSYTVMALLARVYLFQENWEQAEYFSSQVIAQNGMYELMENLSEVFLPNSSEAIWQISPAGWGGRLGHTREGNLLVRISSGSSPVELSDEFMDLWSQEDERFQDWIGTYSDETGTYQFPYKYKIQYDASGGDLQEYSMVMRLAEQYLIRAEARLQAGDLQGAVADIDAIRERANIPLVSDTLPGISESELLNLILIEKRKELFSEWGHRWLELKRTNTAGQVIGSQSPLWESTDVFYPIPEQERMKNPNLEQNEGY